MKTTNINSNPKNRLWSGVILLVIGIIFFLRNFGVDLPHWIFRWPMLLIAIGLFIGFKRNFRGGGWLILVLIGGFFTIQNIGGFDFSRYFFAMIFIALGLYLILKPRSGFLRKKNTDYAIEPLAESQYSYTASGEAEPVDKSDVIDSVSVFGGSNRKVCSKNLKGGDVVAIFGGCELNLTHADFQGSIQLEVVAIFGGVKIIVPPTWEIVSEVTAILGGTDDKRAVVPFGEGPRKLLTIKGLAMFGGVEIKNY